MNVIGEAVPFSFGPASKLSTLSEYLLKEGNNVDILNPVGPSRDFFSMETNTRYRFINIKDVPKKCEEYNLSISVMADELINALSSTDTFRVLVDSLFWMWNKIPFKQPDLYVIQNFKWVSDQLEKLDTEYIISGPIINTSFSRIPLDKREDNILINFGGLKNKYYSGGGYTKFIFNTLWPIFKRLASDYNIYVGGNMSILKRIVKELGIKDIKLVNGSHKKFIDILHNSKMLITSPGLTTSFEAFYYRIPTVFLPPQNYSQVFNLLAFQKEGIFEYPVNIFDVLPESSSKIKFRMEEKVGLHALSNYMKKLINSKRKTKQLTLEYKNVISDYIKNSKARVKRQTKFLKEIGEPDNEKLVKTMGKKSKK